MHWECMNTDTNIHEEYLLIKNQTSSQMMEEKNEERD